MSALPVITVRDQTVTAEGKIVASSLIASAYDPNGYAITYYDFRDEGGNGGYLSLNGIAQPTWSWITISASNLAQLQFVGGSAAGSEMIDVAGWDGYNWSYYQTATVVTQVVLLPVIEVQDQSVLANSSIQASSLITSATDPNGYSITYYDFRDDGGGAGYLSLNGVRQATNTWITVSSSGLSQLQYVGGSSAGTETIDVGAWDGYNWSYYQTATVTTKAAALPLISVQDPTVDANATIPASSLITSASDPNGYSITYYDFRDDGGGGGYLALNGVRQATNSWITVSAADLWQLQYVGGSSAGTERIDVADWDGVNWSYYQTATVSTKAAPALPVVTVQNETVGAGAKIAAASLIASATDPNGYAITEYDFRDSGGNGGYLTLNGVRQASGVWITVTASNVSQLQFVGGTSGGNEAIDVADWDGVNWSYYQTATVTTRLPLLPLITVQDQTLSANDSMPASSLIAAVDDPNGYAITAYDFRDDGGNGGYLTLNGVRQATGTWTTVTASNLSQLRFASGSAAGTETIDVSDWDGYNWSYYQTATVVTKPAHNANPPVVVANNRSVNEYQSIQASSLIASVSDPQNLTITYYGFLDQGGDGGYFILDGVRQATGSWITVNASALPNLLYVGGSTPGNEAVSVEVSDGQNWSSPSDATVTTQAVQVLRPVITAQDATVNANATIQASSLIASATNPNGYLISAYDFRDDGGGAGYLTLNGVRQAASSWITVSAGNLAQLQYVGSGAGIETIDLAAWDGVNWSYYQTAEVTTKAAGLPVITAHDQTLAASASIPAASLIGSVSDPNGYSVTSYRFRDDGGNGGYLSLNGVKQATNTWITISTTNLPRLQFVGGTTAANETVDIAAWDGANWSNYVTATVSVQGTLPSNSLVDKLTDSGIKADATKYISNNTLSYSGMLAILQDAAVGGITASEFQDLKTIVTAFNKSGGVKVSTYLAYITNSLVNGDPANAYWTGGADSPVALGNLAAGSSQTQVNELIDKWFLGTDLPSPIFEPGSPTDIAYVNDTKPLFGANGLPSINDINQGDLGDCYLLASLAEVAQDDPSVIQSMLIDNGNGSYGVRFFISGNPVYVTVNTALPEFTSTGQLCANNSADIWGCLVEKAYVQLNAEPGFLEHTSGNSYILIDGGWADPITQVTGKPVTSYRSAAYSAASWNNLESTFVSAIQSGQEVDFASWENSSSNGKQTFVSQHMYSGIGYDSSTGDFILRNPWGVEPGQNWLTQFEASISGLYNAAGAYGGIFVATGSALATPTDTVSAVAPVPVSSADVYFADSVSGNFGYYAPPGGSVAAAWYDLDQSSTGYSAVGTGDFTGNGVVDILYRNNATGLFGYYSPRTTGTTWVDLGHSDPSYTIVGVGDFAGNGQDDVLFRNSKSGDFGIFSLSQSGPNTWQDLGPSSAPYLVVGVDDFNGDGKADVLFRDAANGDFGYYTPPTGSTPGAWHDLGLSDPNYDVVGLGNFSGSGSAQILFRQASNGDFGYYTPPSNGSPGTWTDLGLSDPAYSVMQIADFSGHGISEVMFRNNSTGDFGYYTPSSASTAAGWHDLGHSDAAYALVCRPSPG